MHLFIFFNTTTIELKYTQEEGKNLYKLFFFLIVIVSTMTYGRIPALN